MDRRMSKDATAVSGVRLGRTNKMPNLHLARKLRVLRPTFPGCRIYGFTKSRWPFRTGAAGRCFQAAASLLLTRRSRALGLFPRSLLHHRHQFSGVRSPGCVRFSAPAAGWVGSPPAKTAPGPGST
jgi:hypothetical protein